MFVIMVNDSCLENIAFLRISMRASLVVRLIFNNGCRDDRKASEVCKGKTDR